MRKNYAFPEAILHTANLVCINQGWGPRGLSSTSRTKSRGHGLEVALTSRNLSILLSIVFTVAVRVTGTVQGS